MASLAEQIADAVYDSLHGQIAAVGTRVYRGRVDPISREECPCINVRLTDETTSNAEIDASTEENELVIVVDVHVAATQAQAWETVADAVVVSAHALIRAGTYPTDTQPPMRMGRSWIAESGDGTPARVSLPYRFQYFNLTAGLDLPG